MYEAEMQRRRDAGVPDNGHTGNNPERPMKDITPKKKPEPSVKRITKMSD